MVLITLNVFTYLNVRKLEVAKIICNHNLITLNVFTYLNVRKLEVAKIICNHNLDQQI